MIFVNIWGSHYPWTGGDTILESYDATIKKLDEMLAEIIGALEKLERPTYLLFISDHGESPRSSTWRNLDDMDLWEIPMFVWLSERYKAEYPEVVCQLRNAVKRPLQSDQIFLGILGLAGIVDYPYYEAHADFMSDYFIPRTRRNINYGSSVYEEKRNCR